LLSSRATQRSLLKRDVDLLEKLPKDSGPYDAMLRVIEARINRMYPPAPGAAESSGVDIQSDMEGGGVLDRLKSFARNRQLGKAAMGAILLVVFGGWTALLVRHHFNPWALLTAFVAFGGFGMLLEGLERRGSESAAVGAGGLAAASGPTPQGGDVPSGGEAPSPPTLVVDRHSSG